ncbi:hypothetical protein FY528_07615 [Hymenobacter lutimineralis]|uniref:Uncharacterized protein n=1 Tax=Hymenobacter lutimineralis TaxID=2606448 RepID=A0A5D6V6N1_9BACT|nr:hypothetical protein [Hymenobacter lutimineralis]TYZ10917.1 hypothetical protein FY528_07615 [Hymenobacter lutimineralis]
MASFFTVRNFSMLGLGVLLLSGCSTEDSITNAAQRSRSVTQAVPDPSLEPATRLPQHYLLVATTDQLPGDLTDQAWLANGTITGTMPEVGLALATSDDPAFLAKASHIPGIRAVIHDFSYQAPKPQAARAKIGYTALQLGSSAYGTSLPGAKATANIKAGAAARAGSVGKGALVAVLGRGNQLLPAFKNHVVGSASFVPGEEVHAAPQRSYDANSPEARVLVVKVLGDKGTGSLGWMLQGLYYAATQRANIVSLDLATVVPRNAKFRNDPSSAAVQTDEAWERNPEEIQTLLVAISKVMNYASKHGVTITAPAKHMQPNGNKRLIHIPADLPNVLAITPQTDLAVLESAPALRQ